MQGTRLGWATSSLGLALVVASTAYAGPGDECSNAVQMVVGVNNFDTTTATPSADPPADETCTFLDWGNSNDVWFVWTPTQSGIATFDFCASGYDTSIVLYTGSCGALTRIGCDDDSCPSATDFQSYLPDVGVDANTTYYLRIGGWNGASGTGSFLLTFNPVSEVCTNASGSCGLAHAGIGCDDPICCNAVCSADPLCCEEGFGWDTACVALAESLCGIFSYECTPGGPSNDCAPNAMLVFDGDAKAFNTTTANTDGPDEAGCNSGAGDLPIWSDLWYRFTAPANGIAVVSCCSTANFDTKIALYDVGDWASFDPSLLPQMFVACNEDGDGCDNYTSLLESSVTAGHTYLARIGGYLQETGNGTISFSLPDPCQLPSSNKTEAEACGADTNGGCNAASGSPTESISIGDAVAGTFWADNNLRDTDWYEFTVSAETNVTWSVYSASFTTAFILSADCPTSVIATGSGACPASASACLVPGTYRVFAAVNGFTGTPCGSGVFNSYVGVLSGEPATCPSSGDTCDNPGPDVATQNSSSDLTVGGVACGAGGITTPNTYARSFTGLGSGEIRCVEFGWSNGGDPIAATLGIYRDTDGGEPTDIGVDLVLIAERDFLLPSATNVPITAAFEEPICLDGNTDPIVVVLDIADSNTGFATYSGNGAGESAPTYIKATSCAINTFVTVGSIGFADLQWVVNINGDFSQCGGGQPCPADLNGDQVVGAADLATLLGQWGGAGTADLSGNGSVGPEDLALLLGAWGPCP